ncbi:hypothetical protein BT93_L5262 [Corymbia citriodora subsp. variegata]|uniref:Cytochrome c oxidase copper chaperone n=1 Tax=Corymbia citriodora subsp. variegata TaxID=360336 RepID=A0A8T0CFA8_CORYI|nr:hypothetical protein BT93_L5262 [Corymbia citriodora subsp. variegata]
MGIFDFFSSTPTQSYPSPQSQPNTPVNAAQDLRTPGSSDSKERPKPCCVCKDEKSERDKCMLYSQGEDPQEDCKGMVQRYRECMKGYGFNVA